MGAERAAVGFQKGSLSAVGVNEVGNAVLNPRHLNNGSVCVLHFNLIHCCPSSLNLSC